MKLNDDDEEDETSATLIQRETKINRDSFMSRMEVIVFYCLNRSTDRSFEKRLP